MAFNKNFVVKNGLEVNTDLILANADTNSVGIGTSVPDSNYILHVNGGIGATDARITGIATVLNELRVGTAGTVFSVIAGPTGFGQSVGVGTASPGYLLDVRSPVSTGQTALYVQGDVRATGDLNIAIVDTTDLNVTGIATLGTVQVSSGIITSTSGIVTYYGDGVYLDNAGTSVTNILYVTQDGNDANTGEKPGDAKRTIGAALAEATTGTVIKVSAGSYVENNPLIIPEQVSIVGDSLREVSVSPQNINQDLFYVSNGNYIAEMSFVGAANTGAIFAFNPNIPTYNNQSPYIQNCTNFIPNSIGLKVDGKHSIGPTKSMVLDSYTQYNQGGIGVSITNEGYAQLVSLFTICNDTAVYCGSGGACDLTNSNSSFGNYALVSDGIGPLKFTGIVTTAASANSDTFVLKFDNPTLTVTGATYNNISGLTTITVNTTHNFSVGMGVTITGLGFTCPSGPGIVTYPSGAFGYIFEVKSIPSSTSFEVNVGPSTLPHTYVSGGTVKLNVVRPFDGQVVYFDQLYYTLNRINVSAGGTGYISRPTVTISSPSVSWGIQAQGIANISNGSVTSIDIISSGRGYTTTPTITISSPDVGINTATASASLLPTYYTIQSSTPITSTGICTITLNDTVPYAVGVGSTVPFFKQSRLLASGHSLEYIGSGTEISSALPAGGGVAIQENETDARNGGIVVFTSTDQSGNFRIGDGVVINQQTGQITGTDYSKSLFSTMTPFILALGG